MEAYQKKNRGYFNDRAYSFNTGISNFGNYYSTTTPNIVSNPMVWNDTLDGFKNPMWKSAIRSGLPATTSMTAVRSTIKAEQMVASVTLHDKSAIAAQYDTYGWNGYPFYQMPNLDSVPTAVLNATKNRALRKFLQEIQNARSSVDSGQDWGEWKELVKGVTNPLGSLREHLLKHLSSMKKRTKGFKRLERASPRFKRSASYKSALKEANKLATDTYLEFTFGWNPLVADVADGLVGLQNRFQQPDFKRVTGSAKEFYSGSADVNDIFNRGGGYCTLKQGVHLRSTLTYKYIGVVRTGAVEGVKSIDATLGLLPERFIPTIWELIPYSFVLDYFVNVGDIINALSFRYENLAWGQYTDRRDTTKTYSKAYWVVLGTPGFLANYSIRGISTSGGGATLRVKNVQRFPVTPASLLPTVEFHFPVSSKPWVNMGAILAGRLGSLVR